ncbi:MAG: carboxymuconolactone decarboxylase family protein [Planctomycetes bacterium]|nr:carboxymuconolactone decarboxylase family protein [Planctomycetota bacterium]
MALMTNVSPDHQDRYDSFDDYVDAKARLFENQCPGDHAVLEACLQACRDHGVGRDQVEELLLQAVLFCGFPRVGNAFRVLQDSSPTKAAPSGRVTLNSLATSRPLRPETTWALVTI